LRYSFSNVIACKEDFLRLFALPGAMMSVMMLYKMPTSYFQIRQRCLLGTSWQGEASLYKEKELLLEAAFPPYAFL
jgi:hypothetical protein